MFPLKSSLSGTQQSMKANNLKNLDLIAKNKKNSYETIVYGKRTYRWSPSCIDILVTYILESY